MSEIYREFASAHSFTADRIESLMQLEMQLERQLLLAVPETLRLVGTQRALGGSVLFVSDTYFSGGVIKHWLVSLGLARSEDSVWTSGDASVTKASGDLYRLVMHAEQLRGCDLSHLGDNYCSDVAVPSALGIRAEWYETGMLTAREQLIEQFASTTGGVASLLAGASRWVRVSIDAQGRVQRSLRDLAAEVAGPVLCAFLLWVLTKAASAGVTRLMFAARDGEVMIRMARPLAEKLGFTFEMNYLYANRQVVHLAGLRTVDESALDWITEGASLLDLTELLARVGLEIADVSAEAHAGRLPLEGPMGLQQVAAVSSFFRLPSVEAKILEAARSRRAEVGAYLEASGLTDGTPCAIVDIGWKGRVFDSLCAIIGDTHGTRHTALYFGLFRKPDPPPPGGQHAYLFDRSAQPPLGDGHDIFGLPNVMEIFTQARHGQVLDVREQDGHFVPVLKSEENDVGPTWDVAYFQDCLVAYAESLALDRRWCSHLPDLRPMCVRLIRELMKQPTVHEARLLGSFQYTDGQNGQPTQFAGPYVWADVITALREGTLPRRYPMGWERGALTMSKPAVRLALRVAMRLSGIRHRVLKRRRSERRSSAAP